MKNAGERTEKPTPRRLLKARREGQYASSKDFVGGLQFAVFTFMLVQFGPKLWLNLRESTRILLAQAFRADLGPAELLGILHQAFAWTLFPMVTASAILVGTGLAFQLTSTSFGMSLHKLAPKGANFNPISKLKSAPQKGFASAVQAVALLGVFAASIYWVVTRDANRLLLTPLSSLGTGLETVRSICMDVMWKATAFFLLAGAIDFFRQKRSFAKQMRMSKHELREEFKETEGNPQIKMRIRRLQKDVRRRRMMEDVKTATAVIVNPTHYAVAIRYHHESMPAPLVVAKGKNYLAQRIRARALENQIPLIENPPLAQALYKSVDVGQQIPAHLYRAVAEILAYVYRLMGKRKV